MEFTRLHDRVWLSSFRKYIKDATLQETVLDKYPVPNNVAEVGLP